MESRADLQDKLEELAQDVARVYGLDLAAARRIVRSAALAQFQEQVQKQDEEDQ